MKFCAEHWEHLRQAVKSRGMWQLVAKDGAAAVARVKEEIEGTASDDNFDPLAAATWAIYGRAIELGGLAMMQEDLCPLCELNRQVKANPEIAQTDAKGNPPSQNWIDGCCDSLLEYCREKCLLSVSLPPPRP